MPALQTDEHRALRDAMSTYWASFARSGDPNQGTSAPAWPAFPGPDKILGFDVASAGGIKLLESSFDTAHKCSAVWTMLAL